MPDKMKKLLKIIEDSLWHNEERDNIVVVPENNFIKDDLSIEDVKIGLETLMNKKIIENYHIRDRIRRACPTSYEEKIECIEKNIPLSGILPKEVLGTALYFIEIKNKEKLIKYAEKKNESNILQEKREIEFDPLNGVITYGKEQYKIQSDIKLALMRKLWEERKEIKINQDGKEETVRKGMMWPKQSLVNNIGKNPGKTYQAINDINGIFREKNFPLKIKRANGAQLIVKA